MRISFDHPHLPKGTPVAILGNLAVVENGGSVEIDDATAKLFEEENETTIEKTISKSGTLSIAGKGGEK